MIGLLQRQPGEPRAVMLPGGMSPRQVLGTTPGRLRAASAALVLAAVCSWAVAAAGTSQRRDAVVTAAQSESLLAAAQSLSAALTDADATVARAFVVGGLESRASRRRFAGGMRAASRQLAIIARRTGESAAADVALRRIARQLPVYSGLVETARANYRQGFPLGAAYLRDGTRLMREEILPAAVVLYEIHARDLDAAYRDGTSFMTLLFAILAGAALLALLAGAQVYVSRATRRTHNVPLLLATAVAIGGAIWLVAGFSIQRDALVSAQREGSDSVQVLSAIRVLALSAQADESLALIARGSGAQALADFDARAASIGSGAAGADGGLLGVARGIAERHGSGASVDELRSSWRRYLAVHDRVVAQQRRGDFVEAVKLAVGSGASSEVALADVLTDRLVDQIAAGQRRFEAHVADAGDALGVLPLGIPLLSLLCAGLGLLGLSRRIAEYR